MKINISKKIKIAKKNRPLIVAEISEIIMEIKKSFLQHIKIAKKAGADLIKIQTYEPSDITIRSKDKKFQIKNGIWKGKYLWELYKEAHTPFKWHSEAFFVSKENKYSSF